jgi:hypothetical protein
MAITPNTTFTAGAVLTAAQMNRLPWGVMGYEDLTANQTINSSSLMDVTSLSVVFTANSTRIYRTSVIIPVITQNTSTEFNVLAIANSSGTSLAQSNFRAEATNQFQLIATYIESGITGSTTRKARMSVSANTSTINSSATIPAFIVVEDIGQA